MQFQTSHQGSVWVLFFHGFGGGGHFAWRMCEILVGHFSFSFGNFFQAFGCAFETGDGFIKISFVNSHILANPFGSGQIIQIVRAKYLDWHQTFRCFQKRDTLFHFVFWSNIRHFPNWICRCFGHTFYFGIFFVVNQNSAIGDFLDENFKLVYIVFIRWKNIDVVPGNSRNQGNVGLIQMEFWSSVYWRRQIFVAFENHKIIFFGQMYHRLEAFELRTHHIIDFDIMIVHHV